MTQIKQKRKVFLLCLLIFLLSGSILNAQESQLLDTVIEEAARSIENTLPVGSKLAVLNFISPSEAFSEYVIEEFAGFLVTGRKLIIVDRSNLMLISQEMRLQLSGEVSDESAQSIGRMLGAEYIATGNLTDLGNRFRLRIKVINVETAAIAAQPSFFVQSDAQTTFLLTGSRDTAAATFVPVQPQTAIPPMPAATTTSAQYNTRLYSGEVFQGTMDLLSAIDWIKLNAVNNGDYTISLGNDEAAASGISLSFNNLQVKLTINAANESHSIRYDVARSSSSLFTVGQGVTFTLEEGVNLIGLHENSSPVITVDGGIFIMNGGTISGNSARANTPISGAGVRINSGSFTMNGGIISGNSASSGGGVYLAGGTFIMNDGTIHGNSARLLGGGVGLSQGTFTMNGGTISGNTADGGGGVGLSGFTGASIFIKSGSGGIIYGSNAPEGQANIARATSAGNTGSPSAAVRGNNVRRDTTARVSQEMDTRQRGAAGGWE